MRTLLKKFVPKFVAPSKLDQVLAYCPDLCDESKQKVCIITDIAKLGRLLENPPLTPHNFYHLYDMSIVVLEAVQHNLQVDLNTREYKARVFGTEL